jgi:hypothetical protein
MLWADLFLRHYEDNQRMAGRVTLVDWNYGAREKAKAAYFWRQFREMTPEEFHKEYRETRHRRAFVRHFPKPGGPIDPLYTTRYLQDRGHDVIGAPAASVGFNLWLPGTARNIANVRCHARSADAKRCTGVFVTRWAETVPHWEPCWPGFAAGAAYAWNPGVAARAFERDFCRTFWGLRNTDVLGVLKDATTQTSLLTSGRRLGLYDGDVGKRNVRDELRESLATNSLPELLDASRRVRRRMTALSAAASGASARARRNTRTLEYIELAADVMRLRTEQAELVVRTVTGRTIPASRWRATERQAKDLRERTRALLKSTLSDRSMRSFLTMHFDGEEALPELARPDRIFRILGR